MYKVSFTEMPSGDVRAETINSVAWGKSAPHAAAMLAHDAHRPMIAINYGAGYCIEFVDFLRDESGVTLAIAKSNAKAMVAGWS